MDAGAESYRHYLEGDDGALGEIIAAYRDGLTLYLNRLVRDFSAAEELAEETFFRVAVRKAVYRGKSSFKTWLYAVGHHTATDWLRHRARLADLPPEDAAAQLADEESAESHVLRQEQQRQLHTALARLHPDYGQVLYLSYFEQFSNVEAAAVMGKSRRQIENLLCRARQSLKAELEKEDFTYEEL